MAKEEKLTKEAQEFLDVLEAKKEGKGPKLIVAQTAPAVRYVFNIIPALADAHAVVMRIREHTIDHNN